MIKFPPFHIRLKLYFTERFPLIVYAPFVIILFFCLSFIVQLLSGEPILIKKDSIIGCVTAFFMMLLIRTFDDIKDEELDRDIFPDRPVSRGAVSIKDVYFLSVLSFVVLAVSNLVLASTSSLVFLFVIVYALLTFKFFFAKKLHIEKPVVAMITHQPLPSLIIFLLIHIALATGDNYNNFTLGHFFLLLTFSLPITAWEISRKTKAKSQEIERYETFSRILGPKLSATLPLLLFAMSGAASSYVAMKLDLSSAYYLLIGIYLAGSAVIYLRFILNPTEKNNVLVPAAMIFTSCMFVTLLVFVFIKHDFSNLL